MATLKCYGCGGTDWSERPSRLFAMLIYYRCQRCGLMLSSVWPPRTVYARRLGLVRLAPRRYPWKSMVLDQGGVFASRPAPTAAPANGSRPT